MHTVRRSSKAPRHTPPAGGKGRPVPARAPRWGPVLPRSCFSILVTNVQSFRPVESGPGGNRSPPTPCHPSDHQKSVWSPKFPETRSRQRPLFNNPQYNTYESPRKQSCRSRPPPRKAYVFFTASSLTPPRETLTTSQIPHRSPASPRFNPDRGRGLRAPDRHTYSPRRFPPPELWVREFPARRSPSTWNDPPHTLSTTSFTMDPPVFSPEATRPDASAAKGEF
ncbi:pollen-specific leucine-rich repeat extensin-like protein 1 [Penaeus monodon]|uniref:pollen-specific leucine-rich repeat extensin-like protein 1 n=1 Tax=Penaeus monodon TaxID=6687 RepID=UPI0018A76E3D|nr:pollen-specific leucine-rich repeat extensin-like protein 1 [Penaeus monodon]